MKNPLKGLEAHPFITRATEGRQLDWDVKTIDDLRAQGPIFTA